MKTTTPITEADITELEDRLLHAMKSSDLHLLDELLHDALLFVTPDGKTITKDMDLDSHKSGSMVIESIATQIESIRCIEDTAIVTLNVSTQGKMLGQPIGGDFKYIRVWKRAGNSFKVIAGSCTQL